jgi:acyl-CoA synthetase (AMP-forming)/AMP-acid ligase II
MVLRTRGVVLVEDDGQSDLAESDARGEEARTLRPLQAAEVIVPKSHAVGSLSEQAVIDWSCENMSADKVPRFVEFRDALPATGAGKVLRRLLRP